MIRNLLLCISLFSLSVFSQLNSAEMAPIYFGETPNENTTGIDETVSDRAFWTIQLDVDPLPIGPGLAGCYWTGTELWVSRWGNDTLYTVSAAGVLIDTFVVAGVTGTRSITGDGTNIYLGANTSAIYKVDPITKTLTSTITTSVPNCRYVTFDPTLDGGAGGFWAGTWATDFTAVSLSGATLSTISAATHGLTTVYGLAYDGVTPSGPYLWAFDQTVAGTGATLVQLSMTGVPTGLTHDTQTDLTGAPNTGLGGGVFVSSTFSPGVNTIGGLSQGVSLFAYQIDDLADMETNHSSTLQIYPNPVESNLSIQTNATNITQINIYSVTGQVIMNVASNDKIIDVSNLTQGIYLLQIQTENGIVTERFVKK